MASEVKRLITRALDSLAVDGLLHAAGQDEPLPVRVVLQPVADRNKSYLWRVRRREVFSLRGEALYLWCVLTKEEDDGGTV